MNDSTNATATDAVEATKQLVEKYNFKTVKSGSKAHEALQDLVAAGKLSDSDLEPQKGEDGAVEGFKRKSMQVTFEVPNMALVLDGTPFSNAQINTIQALVERQVVAANKEAVDNCTGEYKHWEKVLEDGIAIRKASTKVTMEMIAAAVATLADFMRSETEATAAGIELIEKLATKKFTITACNKLPLQIVERAQAVVLEWYESLSADKAAEFEPVINLWASELEKTLNPEQEEIDVNMLG